jgi:hypothetical protein
MPYPVFRDLALKCPFLRLSNLSGSCVWN